MKLSHLNALRALEATLRHGSFSEAADELGITPAAVGQRVRSLEEYLGRELFTRTSTGVEPTDMAQGIGSLLTSGFSQIALALEKLSSGQSRNSLRVTLPESFAENWLAPVLSHFQLQYPEVELHLGATNRDLDLLVEDFDLAIRYGPASESQFEERVLFGDFIVPVCSPKFARRYSIEPSLRSLAGIPLLHVTHRTKDPGWVGFESWGKAFGFDPKHLSHGIRFTRTGSGLQAAAAGQGLALCGIVEAFGSLRDGRLVLPFGGALRHGTRYAYRLVWTSSRSEAEFRENFISWITEQSRTFQSELESFLTVGLEQRT
ncbi:LysR substrate-binding domain-containing protein [Leisingera sp. JC11]|uniref:LysR substrate-binding domain-containing protein n=1 Tax=Leisingera sp. JC11 TaxID=3042469 RepID=UPI00345314A0